MSKLSDATTCGETKIYGATIPDDVIGVLGCYGSARRMADGGAFVYFRPHLWNQIPTEHMPEATAFDAYMLLKPDGTIAEFGHAAARLNEIMCTRSKARVAQRGIKRTKIPKTFTAPPLLGEG